MSGIKTCTKCGETKPVEEFKRDSSTACGFKQPCKKCNNAYKRLWLRESRSEAADRDRAGRANFCAQQKRLHQELRAKILAAYGKQCACCGEAAPEFLTIDHVNNDGAAHRRQVGGGTKFYKWLVRQGFPKGDYQLLCFNCNCAKWIHGQCPHEKDRKSSSIKARG